MRLDPLGDKLADLMAASMLAHGRATTLHARSRNVARTRRIALEVRQLTQTTLGKAAKVVVEYCQEQGLGIKNFEAEVQRRKIALREER